MSNNKIENRVLERIDRCKTREELQKCIDSIIVLFGTESIFSEFQKPLQEKLDSLSNLKNNIIISNYKAKDDYMKVNDLIEIYRHNESIPKSMVNNTNKVILPSLVLYSIDKFHKIHVYLMKNSDNRYEFINTKLNSDKRYNIGILNRKVDNAILEICKKKLTIPKFMADISKNTYLCAYTDTKDETYNKFLIIYALKINHYDDDIDRMIGNGIYFKRFHKDDIYDYKNKDLFDSSIRCVLSNVHVEKEELN